jgi:hypothetical protein
MGQIVQREDGKKSIGIIHAGRILRDPEVLKDF